MTQFVYYTDIIVKEIKEKDCENIIIDVPNRVTNMHAKFFDEGMIT